MKKKILIFAIILLASFLRLYKLDSIPALNADEAAIGYNVYSLIETGKDEHGNPWPIHFQSFNDYKPGLYFYLVLPFVKFFGLNTWAVRLPNVILSIASVYLIYLLVGELFKKEKVAIAAAAMLSISPWHLHFSRGGWEVNTATFLILTGLWLFLKSLKNNKYLFLSALLFILSLYTYHAARVVVPLISLGLVLIYWKKLVKRYKTIIIVGIVSVLLLLPLITDFARGEIVSRAAGVGLFADTGPLARINEQRGEHSDFQATFPVVLHNKLVNYGLAFIENWSDHFHGDFLFLNGDVIERNRVPETGQMYLYDAVFIIMGFITIAGVLLNNNSSGEKNAWMVVILWLIVAPTAAALTFQSPHALRAQNMVIPLVVISAYGLVNIFDWLASHKNKRLFIQGIIIISVFVFWCFVRYEHMYFVHMAKEYPYSSQYGLEELTNYVRDNGGEYKNVVVTNRYDQPYILFLFYLKYPPKSFQGNHSLTRPDKYGFSTVDAFDKFIFKQIDWDADKTVYPSSLIVGTDEEIPQEANIVKEIIGSNGYKYFEVVAN